MQTICRFVALFYDFLWESHIRKSFFMPKMKCWYYSIVRTNFEM